MGRVFGKNIEFRLVELRLYSLCLKGMKRDLGVQVLLSEVTEFLLKMVSQYLEKSHRVLKLLNHGCFQLFWFQEVTNLPENPFLCICVSETVDLFSVLLFSEFIPSASTMSAVAVAYEMHMKYLGNSCSAIIDILKEFTLLNLKGISDVSFFRNLFSQFPLK